MNLNLDPDFEQNIKARCIVHLVRVEPVAQDQLGYNIVVLLPDWPFQDQGISAVSFLMNDFLERGDRFAILQIPDQPFDVEKGTPVLSFNPSDKEEYFWLVPPKHLYH